MGDINVNASGAATVRNRWHWEALGGPDIGLTLYWTDRLIQSPPRFELESSATPLVSFPKLDFVHPSRIILLPRTKTTVTLVRPTLVFRLETRQRFACALLGPCVISACCQRTILTGRPSVPTPPTIILLSLSVPQITS